MRNIVWLTLAAILPSSSACNSAHGAPAQGAGLAQAARVGAESTHVVARRLIADLETEFRVGYAANTSPSPDGRYLAIADQAGGDVVLLDLAGGPTRRVTHNAAPWRPGGALIPRFSPDGKRIAFEWEPAPAHDRSEIRVIDVDGSHERTIESSNSPAISETDPIDWSPDGHSVLATRFLRDGTTQILLVATDALRAPRVLKSVDWRTPNELFSPDGRYVAYDHPSRTESNNRGVFVIELATGRESQILDADSDNRLLAWTREGGLIFISDRTGTPGAWALPMANGLPSGTAVLVKSDLWRATPVGMAAASGTLFYAVEGGGKHVYTAQTDRATGSVVGVPTQLTPTPLTNIEDGFMRLAWSPDGRDIAYSAANDAQNTKLEIIRSTETGKTREFPLLGRQGYFTDQWWLPDGSGLVMLSGSGFVRLDAQSGHVTELPRARPADKPQGYRFAGITADGREAIRLARVPRDSGPSGKGCEACGVKIVAQDLSNGAVRTMADFGTSLGKKVLCCHALSPDGAWLAVIEPAFDAPATAPGGEVILLPTHGGEARVIASKIRFASAGHNLSVAWSHDGRWIYFAAADGANGLIGRVMKVSSGGGTPEDTGLRGELVGPLRVAPDGRIAYATGRQRIELWALEHLPGQVSAASNPSKK